MKLTLVITLVLAITTRWVSAEDAAEEAAAPEADLQRTVIFIQKAVGWKQFVFVRGGVEATEDEECINDVENDPCAVPIVHNVTNVGSDNAEYSAWSEGDNYLDWYGAEPNQGTFDDQAAYGTPMVWTTNDPEFNETVAKDGYGYTELNTWGPDYWMVEIDMDCTKTNTGANDGWFQMKGFGPGPNDWEGNVDQDESCEGDEGGSKPFSSGNHFAKCGCLNMFTFQSNSCLINALE